jgi:serine/threonine-protein kinase
VKGPAEKVDLGGRLRCPVCSRHYSESAEFCPVDGALLLSSDALSLSRIGEVLSGRYHVKDVVGHGGMGTVFAAVQQPIGRKVAVKVLHPDLAKDTTFVTRFHTEAKAASVLVNPNTVTIHDFGQTEDGTLFIAMEYLEGDSLADRLDLGALPWRHAAAIGAQVCRALAEAHRKGIVHRDQKPQNIMLLTADDGSLLVKVLDFGIAKMLQSPGLTSSGAPVTQVGVIIGTPQYMSPEQAQGK